MVHMVHWVIIPNSSLFWGSTIYIYMPFSIDLGSSPTRGGRVLFPTRWCWARPRDLLRPTELGGGNGVPLQAEVLAGVACSLCLTVYHSWWEHNGGAYGHIWSRPEFSWACNLSPELNLEIEFLKVNHNSSQTHEGEINACFKSLNFGVVFHEALL